MLRVSALRPTFTVSTVVSGIRAVPAIGHFNYGFHVISNPRGGVQVCIVVRSGVRLPQRGQKLRGSCFGGVVSLAVGVYGRS